MPFPRRYFDSSQVSNLTPRPKKSRKLIPKSLRRLWREVLIRRDEKQLMRELEYDIYLSYSIAERRRHDWDYVLRHWPQRLLASMIILVGYFILGFILDLVPMDRPSAMKGAHIVGVGCILAWLVCIWNYIRLERFRSRAKRFMKRSMHKTVRKL